MKKDWVAIEFNLKTAYLKIAKGSVVKIGIDKYVVKRIDGVILMDEAVQEPCTVKVYARGVLL